jgi:transketolase
MEAALETKFRELSTHFPKWQKVADLIDQLIDIILNYRQSGHPGGSRSKVHVLVATLLGGGMRWDIRHPESRFGDRFILVAGHTIPLIYCTFAVFDEAMRIKHQQTGDARYYIPENRAVLWEDLLRFRRNGGLPGHAEMEGKTLFLKFNTGPSGHGSPAAAGEALALKRASAQGVKVIALEGDGGLTPGASHETRNTAWGLGLDNLYYIVDWNDFGIDDHRISDVVHGTPVDWFKSFGWRVLGTEKGSEWGSVTRALLEMFLGDNPNKVPSVTWVKTRKGRGYLKYDNKSHGSPHARNSDLFWQTKVAFAERYGVWFEGFGQPAPEDSTALQAQFKANLRVVMSVLHDDQELVDYLADTLVALGDAVPQEIPSLRLNTKVNPIHDQRLYDYEHYPAEMYVTPGTKIANRRALAKWGAWVNAFAQQHYHRPLFLACSADLADSTNISGFAEPWGDFPGYGWYDRERNPEGVLLPQTITEFTNSGLAVGLATVNLSENPYEEFNGFFGACSTYGSFVYLKYALMRLFSQLAQDCQIRVGKVVWVAGHSGPETADDSRTHFGIFSPGVTQLFPQGQIINLHPWEYNEVPVVLGAALKHSTPIIALHLTRPAIEIPDRAALGIPSHFAAAKGAYVVRDYRPTRPRTGTVIVQGTSAISNILKILPKLDKEGPNVKIVAAISPELFALQPEDYRNQVLSPADQLDAMPITTQARRLMSDWIFCRVNEEYALSADWDSRWRTGGTVDEIIEEAHLSADWLMDGIERFVQDRDKRLGRIRAMLETARQA